MNKLKKFNTLENAATDLRKTLNTKNYALLFAYNGIGKTRLSMEFKDLGKDGRKRDTLYFNAFTEDLFFWDNDLEKDKNRGIRLNMRSRFFKGLKEFDAESKVREILKRHVDFDFKFEKKEIEFDDIEKDAYQQSITLEDGAYYINYISFEREIINNNSRETIDHIKISRGEENIFLWCFFLAIAQLAFDAQHDEDAYSWVKYIYIDDPVSSLDENNLILIACDLVRLILDDSISQKIIISTHHTLFYNVLSNEFKSQLGRGWQKNLVQYFIYFDSEGSKYQLKEESGDKPYAYHLAILEDLKKAALTNTIRHYHFNMLRSTLEKTAVFFGYKGFGECIENADMKALYSRVLNLYSHGNDSIFTFRELDESHKQLFSDILEMYLNKFDFNLPETLQNEQLT